MNTQEYLILATFEVRLTMLVRFQICWGFESSGISGCHLSKRR